MSSKTPDISKETIDSSLINLVPYETAVHYNCIPFGMENNTLKLAVTDSADIETLADIRFLTGKEIQPYAASKEEIQNAIEKAYADHQRSRADRFSSKSERSFESTPIVELANKLISEAIHRRASDIHCEPGEESIRVRFRIDGMLNDVHTIPYDQKNEFISRLKIMAGMDIAEKRRPQDGRIQVESDKLKVESKGSEQLKAQNLKLRTIDIRVSSLPTEYGEKMVLRILDKGSMDMDLEGLGLDAERLEVFRKAIQLPHGIILLTGPTGSGKTTTLYAALNYIKHPGLNISTVEDPIEYNLAEINQTQVNPEINLTFANALRTLLRQDPNVIMVGEIRDPETADIAIRSGLTGHLVLSTLHTNDAPSAVTRLLDMGVEPFLASSTVVLLAAQRLVRRICEKCKKPYEPTEREMDILSESEKQKTYYKGKGCSHCIGTGYRGRIGIYEIMPVSETIKSMIGEKKTAMEIRKQAVSEGMKTLREDGLEKAGAGITTLEEVLRETASL